MMLTNYKLISAIFIIPLSTISSKIFSTKVLTKKEYDTIAEPYRKREKEILKQNMKVLQKSYR